MDWPFETFVQHPPRRLCGFAEIVGYRDGAWQVGHVYVADRDGWRHAGFDERQEVALALQMHAGTRIGGAYRRSLEGGGAP